MNAGTFAAVMAAGFVLGCASRVEVTRSFTPAEAANVEEMTPVAVLRDNERIPIPKNARIQPEQIVVGRGEYVHKLGPRDILEQDAEGRIVAVRTDGNPPVEIRFVPGTVRTPDGTDEVRGQLEGGSSGIALKPTDRIEMRGTFGPGDSIPGGGRVESRSSGMLIFGGLLVLGLSYVPALYGGLQSERGADATLAIPVLGPWINLAGRGKCSPPENWNNWPSVPDVHVPVDPCIDEKAARIAVIATGAAQALGAGLTVLGFALTKTEVVNDSSSAQARRSTPTFAIVPTTNGLRLSGTF